MTIALIAIPQHLPARIVWFQDSDALLEAALAQAMLFANPHVLDLDDAIHYLSPDWNMHLLIQCRQDLQEVAHYKGHQQRRVRAMLEQLNDVFMIQEVPNHEST